MARGVNRCIFIGHLGKDAEIRYGQTGKASCSFSIAVGESWRDRTNGETRERTEWINVVIFDQFAESIHEYLTKGTQVYVEGKYRTEKWQDKDGKDRYTTKIYAEKVQLLGGQRRQESREEPAARQQPQERRRPAPADDDDIPF